MNRLLVNADKQSYQWHRNALAILDRVVTDSEQPQYMTLHMMRLRFGSEIGRLDRAGWVENYEANPNAMFGRSGK